MEKVELAPASPVETAPKEKEIVAVILPAGLVESILRYLGTKPWDEVNGFQHGIRTSMKPIYKEDLKQPELKDVEN